MKKYLFVFIILVLIMFGLFVGKQQQEQSAFMDDLLLHQPIDIEAVEGMYINQKEIDINHNIIKAFNEYPATQIAEKNIDKTKGELMMVFQGNIVIKLLYSDSNLWVKRNDVGEGEIVYQLKETVEPVEALFLE
ncbi:hypothetical protein [Gracilibacillus suaedae]|uniref:hypothetical protein n=1 Tax=Gracilibacillus suaedae TaxID=2820273 RepID=UPI001ABDFB49|nr:hypothetical protein [Gracilibacillus suaedae]